MMLRSHAERVRWLGRCGLKHTCSLALLLLFAGSSLASELVVDRQQSTLQFEYESTAPGTWEVVDETGFVCAGGALATGSNSVLVPKLASPVDVSLWIRTRDETFEKLIPGEPHLSPLAKPEHGAVIYQLPVRTYAARGMGRAKAGQLAALTSSRLHEIAAMGVDYLWVTGALEHASRAETDPDVVKGEAGSFYAIHDKWDVSSQIGRLADFEALIDRAHAAGLRVIIDFVGNHTARMHRTDVACKQRLDFGSRERSDVFFDPHNNYYHLRAPFAPPALAGVDGADGVFDTDLATPGIQYEAPARVTGNNIMLSQPHVSDWFETAKLNYGYDIAAREAFYSPRPRTWTQMIDVAKYWVEKGVDGFRVDMAHAVPIQFWQAFAAELKAIQPHVFLLAEAYENDWGMRLPDFSYQALFEAGFDSVYNSEMYWAMRRQADDRPGTMRDATASHSPALRRGIIERGFMFTQYMENHDEVRLASKHFARYVPDRGRRADLGLAYSAYLGLMPGHLMLHGGQELQEDASIFGPYAGDNGRTSIFDFVYQSQTRSWLYGERPEWMRNFRRKYERLLQLKRSPVFAARHTSANPTLVDLDAANWYKEQSKWVGAYVRHMGPESYLVVTNSDPFNGHEATIHFTSQDGIDTLGALGALGVSDSAERFYNFEEVFSRPGWIPQDPAIGEEAVPGSVLYRSGNVPSGLYLGIIPAATTYVFKITER